MWWCISGLISVLIAMNGFFVKRLVDKIDSTDNSVGETHVRLAALEQQVFDLKEMVQKQMFSHEHHFERSGHVTHAHVN